MFPPLPGARPCGCAVLVLICAFFALGCGDSRYPVTGRVLVKGKVLAGKTGTVVLKPDTSKGNQNTVPAVGVLQRDGSFDIQTDGRPGARRGWYKVLVIATDPNANPNEDARRVVHPRYVTDAATPLTLEVVANPPPGGYDLQLSP